MTDEMDAPAYPGRADTVNEHAGTDWGRIGADGTVYVRTADGERAVGSWQAGSPQEALEFYQRRYAGLVVEIDLLETRLREADVPAKEATAAIERLSAAVADAAAVGDLAALQDRLTGLVELAGARAAEQRAERAAATEAARSTKERIVTEAEKIAGEGQWRAGGDRLRALLEEWKACPRLDRRSDDELWKRFAAARSSFSRRRKEHYAQLGKTRDAARAAKEKLVAQAEELATSTAWGPTAGSYRDLMSQWKAAGRARREVDDALWARFRAAQDAFFSARNAAFAEKDAALAANLTVKEELAAEAEELVPVTDARSARAALRGIQERWHAAGHVPRDARDRVEGRLSAVETAVRAAEEEHTRRNNPTARARAEETVAAIRASIEALSAKAEKARAAGNEKQAREAEEGVAARREWLTGAERTLAEFT